MSTRMLCSILRVPVDRDSLSRANILTIIQVLNAAKRAADLIELLSAAIREANDCDTTERGTDQELDDWRKLHADAIRAAEDFS